MRRRPQFLLLIVVPFFFSCRNNNDSETFYARFYQFTPLIKDDKSIEDTTSYIISFYDFDCSVCIGEMMQVSKILSDYSNIYFIISSKDSIAAHYYLDEINPNATVLWDKERLFFLNNYKKLTLANAYCVFVVKNNRLIYARNPLQNKFETLHFKHIIRQFKKQ